MRSLDVNLPNGRQPARAVRAAYRRIKQLSAARKTSKKFSPTLLPSPQ
ncbi:hypothetical protein C7S17_2690 [Burkholderia thailandensis]|nr:hypothetical protein [Burkholderia thailandensis]